MTLPIPDLPIPDPVAHAVAAACLAIAAIVASVGAWLVRGTTAVPAAAWAVAATGCFMAVEAFAAAGRLDPASAASARLVATALAVCPAMSLLGAKRPQHGVWQIIVASLAVVLAMPAASAALVRPGSLPDVHLLGRGFLLALTLAGWVNFLGTRRIAAATLVTLGLLLLARPFLPGIDTARAISQPMGDLLGGVAVAAGAVAAVAGGHGVEADEPITASFAALRDTIGAAWSLRIAERFNATAESRGWPCRLSLSGLEVGGDPDDDSWREQAKRVYESLMRRFVSREWLTRHWHGRGEAG